MARLDGNHVVLTVVTKRGSLRSQVILTNAQAEVVAKGLTGRR